jgi:hypothetical protein
MVAHSHNGQPRAQQQMGFRPRFLNRFTARSPPRGWCDRGPCRLSRFRRAAGQQAGFARRVLSIDATAHAGYGLLLAPRIPTSECPPSATTARDASGVAYASLPLPAPAADLGSKPEPSVDPPRRRRPRRTIRSCPLGKPSAHRPAHTARYGPLRTSLATVRGRGTFCCLRVLGPPRASEATGEGSV